jgi:uncharacterized small protein (DUF1192 family)
MNPHAADDRELTALRAEIEQLEQALFRIAEEPGLGSLDHQLIARAALAAKGAQPLRTCGEMSCDECNAEKAALRAEVARLEADVEKWKSVARMWCLPAVFDAHDAAKGATP